MSWRCALMPLTQFPRRSHRRRRLIFGGGWFRADSAIKAAGVGDEGTAARNRGRAERELNMDQEPAKTGVIKATENARVSSNARRSRATLSRSGFVRQNGCRQRLGRHLLGRNVLRSPCPDARRSARKFMRYLLLLLALTVCAVHAKTPEETIRSYVDQVKVGGLGRVAALMHPDELEKFRGMLRPFIDEALKEEEGRAEFGQFAEASDKTKQKQLSPEVFMSLFLTWLEGVQPQLSEVLKASTEVWRA